MLTIAGNILVNGHSNAIALVASPALTICDNTLKQSM
jgi:hypothetical protein